jgi:hypothetical protein
VRLLRRIAITAVIAGVLSAVVSTALYGNPVALAASTSTSLHDVLSQLRRNSKVSERLNAGFFRAPQTRAFVGSAFQPTNSNVEYIADRGDSALSLAPKRPTTDTETNGGTTTVKTEDQTTGTFEYPLDIPNRAQVVKVTASYRDAAGGNTTTNGQAAPSGMNFQVLELGQLGDSPKELLATPAGVRSRDGQAESLNLPLLDNGFRVNDSLKRYVLRVTLDDVQANTRFYGITVQYVIGKGVAGAPSS